MGNPQVTIGLQFMFFSRLFDDLDEFGGTSDSSVKFDFAIYIIIILYQHIII